MGGNIWKEDSVRLTKQQYLTIQDDVQSLLINKFPNIVIKTIASMYDKETFGDLDLLVQIDPENNCRTVVKEYLTSLGFKTNCNGEVLSFLYNNFQVDLIFVNKLHTEYAQYYFSWNDCGNLIGRIAKQLGVKHSHLGLYYINRKEDGKLLNQYLLSTDYSTILDLLYLDKSVFYKGFNTKKELFDWIISSPYFNYDKFKLINLDHKNRVRDRKRVTYNEFLTYLEALPSDSLVPKILVTDKLNFVLSQFPHLKQLLEDDALKEKQSKVYSEYYNGILISQITGLTGKELGTFISQGLLNTYTKEYLINNKQNNLKLIKECFDLYNN